MLIIPLRVLTHIRLRVLHKQLYLHSPPPTACVLFAYCSNYVLNGHSAVVGFYVAPLRDGTSLRVDFITGHFCSVIPGAVSLVGH